MAFNQRRKTMRNSLKQIIATPNFDHPFLNLRPEVLSVEQFIELTQAIEQLRNQE
jgi:16S rRNA (adenine1518-N6/adenine1519-N6)-dimethyltransferase